MKQPVIENKELYNNQLTTNIELIVHVQNTPNSLHTSCATNSHDQIFVSEHMEHVYHE